MTDNFDTPDGRTDFDAKAERKARDVEAIRNFYDAMKERPLNAQLAAMRWLSERFASDRAVRALADARRGEGA